MQKRPFSVKLLAVFLLTLLLFGCAEKASLSDVEKNLAAGMAQKPPGADFPSLDYVSEELAIVHDYWGLVVYSLQTDSLLHVLDLAPLGMNKTQGDAYADVTVSKDGSRVLLRHLSPGQGPSYLYDTQTGKTEETNLEDLGDDRAPAAIPIEDERAQVLLDKLALSSAATSWAFFPLENNRMAFLTLPDGETTMGGLTLCISDGKNARQTMIFGEIQKKYS